LCSNNNAVTYSYIDQTWKQAYEAFLLSAEIGHTVHTACLLHEALNDEFYRNHNAKSNIELSDEDLIIANHDLSPGYVGCNYEKDAETIAAIQRELDFDEGDGTQETDNLSGFSQSGLPPEMEGASVLASSRVPAYVPTFAQSVLPRFIDTKSYLAKVINPQISLSNQFEGTNLFRESNMPVEFKVRKIYLL